MNAMGTAFYDAAEKTLWVARRLPPKTRVERDEVMEWVAILRDGKTEEGDQVSRLNALFLNRESAAYNYQTLAFVDIGVYYEDGGNRIRYEPPEGALEVDVRADFGIVMPED